MKILFISEKLPLPDHASGDLRFFSLMRILATANEVHLVVFGYPAQQEKLGKERFNYYRHLLHERGIHVHLGHTVHVLRQACWDVIVFEFYHAARPPWLLEAKYHNPQVKLGVDSVDVHFKRLNEKAKITNDPQHRFLAEQTKKKELSAYDRADFVLAVTDQDRQIIETHLPDAKTVLVPNIHRIYPPDLDHQDNACRLIFVGGFQHDPNTDAVLYFCRDILPKIAAQVPVEVYIVGSSPPPQIRALNGGPIVVTGYVEDTVPYLKHSHISIAPLRYGAGMKGKIGEAMAAGLPVVTTSVGAEGFGFVPGEHILIGDTPEAFAENIVMLYKNKQLYEKLRLSGWKFIRDHYSEESLRPKLLAIFQDIQISRPKPLPLWNRLVKSLAVEYERRIAWRFK